MTYYVPVTCIEELDANKATPWHQNYGFLSRDVKVPIVGLELNSDEVLYIINFCVSEVLNILAIYSYLDSHWYRWGLGNAMGSFLANIFVAVDRLAELNIITPTPAHTRYLDN